MATLSVLNQWWLLLYNRKPSITSETDAFLVTTLCSKQVMAALVFQNICSITRKKGTHTLHQAYYTKCMNQTSHSPSQLLDRNSEFSSNFSY